MRTQKVTIKDIARELGVSPSTVSRALKDHPDISPQTRKQVKDLVEKLNYQPNAIALSLRNNRTNIIGVMVPELVHHFFSSVISGIESEAMKSGFNVMLFQSGEDYEREVLNTKALINSRVDGVLVSVAKTSKKFSHIKQLIENGIPVVFFDRVCDDVEADKVVVDDFEGAFNATEYLIKSGCKRIAHFGSQQHLQIGYQRKRGYITALEKHGLEVDDNLFLQCDTFNDAMRLTEVFMRQSNRPDGIFSVNDITGVGALNVIKRMGLRVPEDVSIIGFSDGLVSSVTEPLLTTVSQHGEDMGIKAASILLKRIIEENEKYTPVTEVIKTDLIIRDSTKPLLSS